MAANPTRVRGNFLKGTLSSTLNLADTTTNAFSGQDLLFSFSAYAGGTNTHHMAVIIDPAALEPEILYITDTDLTAATIVRSREGTIAATSNAIGTPYIVAPTTRDYTQGWAGPFALASANSNPTFANTSGVWTSLPHSTSGANLIRSATVRAGDLFEVHIELVAKVTAGTDYIALDLQLAGLTGNPMVGSSSGATGLALTKSTAYTHLHAYGSAEVPEDGLITPAVFYKASGAGTFGCNASLPETNFDVISSWRVTPSAVG